MDSNGDLLYKEWAPEAAKLTLFGDFNNWHRDQYHATKNEYGQWNLKIPAKDGQPVIKHGQKFKICIYKHNGEQLDRNPAWARYLI